MGYFPHKFYAVSTLETLLTPLQTRVTQHFLMIGDQSPLRKDKAVLSRF